MDSVITWIESNKTICWGIFWVGWFFLSPATIIPGAVAVGVGNVIYKERALNLVTICAVYLGILAYLLLGHSMDGWPENVRLYMGFAGILLAHHPGQTFPNVWLLPDRHDRQRVLSRQRRPLPPQVVNATDRQRHRRRH